MTGPRPDSSNPSVAAILDPEAGEKSDWEDIMENGFSTPALLTGGSRASRALAVKRYASIHKRQVAAVKIDGSRINRFQSVARGFGLSMQEGHTLLYVELEGNLRPEIEDALSEWIAAGRHDVAFGRDVGRARDHRLVEKGPIRYRLPSVRERLPRSLALKGGHCFTVFGRRDQSECDDDILAYIGLAAEAVQAVAFGSETFEAGIRSLVPHGSFVLPTTTNINQYPGMSDADAVRYALREELDHVIVQNFETFKFNAAETWLPKPEGIMVYFFRISHVPVGGMVAATRDELFRRTLASFPAFASEFEMEENYRRSAVGRKSAFFNPIRILWEGEDVSREFRDWVSSGGFQFENGVLSPAAMG